LVGEHLSVENMNRAIQAVADDMNICLPEFTVAGIPYQNFFAHHWFIACDDPVDEALLRTRLDNKLKELNDDYAVERRHALKEVFVTVLPEHAFIDFLASKGKIGSQNKFPRVLKGKMLTDWEAFLKSHNIRVAQITKAV
jgi:hypothetical protein